MGFDTMRMNSARCPPFLVAGLLVMCVLLTCNWWTLSSQNYDILKEMEEMGEQLRKCSSLKNLCESERSIADGRLQAAQSMANANAMKMTSKDNTIKELESARDKTISSLKTCESELENVKQLDESRASVLALLRLEKTALTNQLQEQKDKVTELEKVIDELKTKSEKPAVQSVSPKVTISPNLASPDLRDPEEEEKSNDGDVRFDISSGITDTKH